jgi:hypothetical protein
LLLQCARGVRSRDCVILFVISMMAAWTEG